VANPCLVALIEGGGFRSLEQFAEAVNHRGWTLHGVKLCYDHVRVKRWITGGTCQYPEVVADVLSTAWSVPIPVGVIWPELREGAGLVPAHLQAWVPARTLEDLSLFLRSDMLARREVLADAVGLVAGTSLVAPIARWLATPPVGLASSAGELPAGRIGLSDVRSVELATEHFRCLDNAMGGGYGREAAVGQLKYAVDLIRHTGYAEPVGDQLLAAIARLACLIGWMSHDVGMEGPAQRYLVYALQAARESRYPPARLQGVSVLCDMARQMRSVGRPDTGLRLVDLALDQLPDDRRTFNAIRGGLWNLKARMLAGMGTSHLAEACSAVNLGFDLHAKAADDDVDPAVAARSPLFFDPAGAELAGVAADCYLDLAVDDPRLAADAERHLLRALASRTEASARSRVFDQILLARCRFLQGEPATGVRRRPGGGRHGRPGDVLRAGGRPPARSGGGRRAVPGPQRGAGTQGPAPGGTGRAVGGAAWLHRWSLPGPPGALPRSSVWSCGTTRRARSVSTPGRRWTPRGCRTGCART
jgi:hypothetical protein